MKRVSHTFMVFLMAVSALPAQDPQWDWVKPLNTVDSEIATAVASDPNSGEVYMAGEWRGILTDVLPAGPTPSTDFTLTFGGVDGLVVKLDPGGNIQWAFKVGGDGDDHIHDIHVDEQGFFYICGTVQNGNSSFAGMGMPDATTEFFNPGTDKAFIARYDPDGMLFWVRFAGGLNFSFASGIATNPDAVFLTGYHQGDISFGTLPPYTSAGGIDLFVTKYSRDGDERWHVSAGSDNDDYVEAITCDETHLYVGGRFYGTALAYKDMTGGVVPATINSADGQADAFVAGFTTDGFHVWTRIIASAADDDCQGIALRKEHIFVAGTIGAEAIFPMFPGNPVPHRGGEDAYVCFVGRDDGATRWVRTLAGDAGGDQVIRDLSLDRSGSPYVTGYFTANVNTVDAINESKGIEDIFLASITSSGNIRWIKTAGGTGYDSGNGLCARYPGIVYLAGEYQNVASFDSKVLPADASQNIFVARLNLDCNDAFAGKLTAPEIIIPEGEALTLVLREYYGDIRWEFSLPGQNNWTLLTTDTRDSIQVFPSGTADYRAFVTSGSCMPDSSNVVTIFVGEPPRDFAEAGADVTICRGDSTSLKASGGDFYKWEPVESLDRNDIPDPWAKPLATTTFTVYVTSADGLTDSDTVTVFVLPRPQLDVVANLEVCQGQEVQLAAGGAGSFRWTPQEFLNDPSLPDPIARVDTTTTFRVVLTDADGCRRSAFATVFVFSPPLADAGPDRELRAQFEVRMNAKLGSDEKGLWTIVSGSGFFEEPLSPVTRVTGLEIGENIYAWNVSNGICPEVTDRVTILVNDFIIPTVITPNGDGKNDFYRIDGIESFRTSELIVLNRWGEEVFRDNPYRNNWDGVTGNGKELPEDTYYVVLKITDHDVRKGTVMILR